MNRIQQTFAHSPIFIAGMVPGYPDIETSFEAYKALIDAGADMIEFSASFSDPIADGKTLQQAHALVLKRGITKEQTFGLYKKLRAYSEDTPFFLIEYANVIYQKGIREYYKSVKEAGIDALAIPDVSVEDSAPYKNAAREYGIDQIFLIALTTPDDRVQEIAKMGSGFLYLVTITGTTGAKEGFHLETSEFIRRVKSNTELPCIAGFGISKPEHAAVFAKAGADGVVSCSHIVDIVTEHQGSIPKMQAILKDYITSMHQAV